MKIDEAGNVSEYYTINGIDVLFYQPFNVTRYVLVNGILFNFNHISDCAHNFKIVCQVLGIVMRYDYEKNYKFP